MVEQLGIAEETGYLDEEAAGQALVLVRMLSQIANVPVEVARARCRHPTFETAQDGWSLVGLKVDSRLLLQLGQKGSKGVLALLRQAPRVHAAHEVTKEGPDCPDVRHDVAFLQLEQS